MAEIYTRNIGVSEIFKVQFNKEFQIRTKYKEKSGGRNMGGKVVFCCIMFGKSKKLVVVQA